MFTLENGLEVEIPNYELAWPARGIDKTGQWVQQDNATVVNIFNGTLPEGTASVGKIFLSQECFHGQIIKCRYCANYLLALPNYRLFLRDICTGTNGS
jgi:hypothetical protein